jgi:AraC family transcriptional regulator, glycine betaine-responsive activator
MTDAPTRLIGLLLLPSFSMMAFTCAIEPLRAANRLAGRELYRWRLLSTDGRPVEASNGIAVMPHQGIEGVDRLPTVLVCAGLDVHDYDDRAVLAWLRRLERHGAEIGALSTGTYVLARAGLLQGYRCTIHWESLPAFAEEFRELEVTSNLFTIDRNRLTCAGGSASLDLMLTLIERDHGQELANDVAEQFIHARIRSTADDQRMPLRARLNISHPKLISVIGMMEQNIEQPLPLTELAERAGLSMRQLERLFQRYLGETPARHYLELRLDRARQLLTQTTMPVLSVALACGFVSASHFSKAYREVFDRAPRDERLPRPQLQAGAAS